MDGQTWWMGVSGIKDGMPVREVIVVRVGKAGAKIIRQETE